MGNDNWEIWNAPACRQFSSIFLIVGAILFAMLRVWFISIPFLTFAGFLIWQFIEAGCHGPGC
jgi:hypothetical protein